MTKPQFIAESGNIKKVQRGLFLLSIASVETRNRIGHFANQVPESRKQKLTKIKTELNFMADTTETFVEANE